MDNCRVQYKMYNIFLQNVQYVDPHIKTVPNQTLVLKISSDQHRVLILDAQYRRLRSASSD